jgi:hypothetical protein
LKNQNDLIVAGAVILVCIGVSLGFFFQRREPVRPANPAPVVVTDAQPAEASVVYANSLPGAGEGSGAGAPTSGSGTRGGLTPLGN